MKKKNIIFLSIFIINFLLIGSIYAQETFNNAIDYGNIVKSDEYISDEILDYTEDNTLSIEPKTWYVEPDPDNPNQVQKPTVQPVINQANLEDTIILNGTFVHCQFTINKTLTLLATPDTTLGVCPHHNPLQDQILLEYFT